MLKLKLKLAAGLIILALLIVFILQNMTEVSVKFIIAGPVTAPLAYLLCAAVLFGMILVGIGFITRSFRLKNMQKKVMAQQDALRQISQNLMVQQAGVSNMRQAAPPLSQSQGQPQFASVDGGTGMPRGQGTAYGNNVPPNPQKANKRKAKR